MSQSLHNWDNLGFSIRVTLWRFLLIHFPMRVRDWRVGRGSPLSPTGQRWWWQGSDWVGDSFSMIRLTSQAFIYSFHRPCGKIYHQFWQKNDVFYVNNSYNYVPSSLWNCSLFEHRTSLQVCSNCPDLLPSLLPTARSSDLPQSSLIGTFPQWCQIKVQRNDSRLFCPVLCGHAENVSLHRNSNR